MIKITSSKKVRVCSRCGKTLPIGGTYFYTFIRQTNSRRRIDLCEYCYSHMSEFSIQTNRERFAEEQADYIERVSAEIDYHLKHCGYVNR